MNVNNWLLKKKNRSIGLTFIDGCTQVIRRVLQKAGFFVFSYPKNTIGQMLPSTKDTIHQFNRLGAIHEIPCMSCNYQYIGETGRCVNTRIKEHKRDLNSRNLVNINETNLPKKTALVKHSYMLYHQIDFYQLQDFGF